MRAHPGDARLEYLERIERLDSESRDWEKAAERAQAERDTALEELGALRGQYVVVQKQLASTVELLVQATGWDEAQKLLAEIRGEE